MNAWKSVQLLRKYSKCKKCGNDKIGSGESTVEIQDDTFKRTCKCGWEVEVNED
ncbi:MULTISPECIES: DUF3797 domain-containing protein [Bacillus cereus group]|uniref:DUF3797 domain-containing protein n=1 Tax=Bacillus cereus group TaxID=86661 RepID=UPI0021D3379E|nr:DUF3797 domain-containing protein [Bacillus paranthracis]MCU5299690.1 DUF3797 domain-containing protein [Bacillus paranthracis]